MFMDGFLACTLIGFGHIYALVELLLGDGFVLYALFAIVLLASVLSTGFSLC